MNNKWFKRTIFTTLGILAVGATGMGIRAATLEPKNVSVNAQNQSESEIKAQQEQNKKIKNELKYLYIGLMSTTAIIIILLTLLIVSQYKKRKKYLFFANY